MVDWLAEIRLHLPPTLRWSPEDEQWLAAVFLGLLSEAPVPAPVAKVSAEFLFQLPEFCLAFWCRSWLVEVADLAVSSHRTDG